MSLRVGITRAFGIVGAVIGTGAAFVVSSVKVDVFEGKLSPLVRAIDPEAAHMLAIYAARFRWFGFGQAAALREYPMLQTTVFGRPFHTPVGLAAGFDKDAKVVRQLIETGFSFVEVGSITPEPQEGNPTPRVFRLEEDRAVINRYGFNSEGVAAAKTRLQNLSHAPPNGVVGVNVGKNKLTENALLDYEHVVRELAPFADYLVVNVSSPNTPGLRDLQREEDLRILLTGVIRTRDQTITQSRPTKSAKAMPPLLLKIAPDLSDADKKSIAKVALEVGVDGLIISNTTVDRPDSLKSPRKKVREAGGLSGQPLFESSTRLLGEMYELTGGKIVLIGVGGVSTGEQAYQKIRQGASLVQLYTALVYEGPKVVDKIKRELVECLRRDGFSSVEAAVGANFRKN